jgi:hypothetical protein
MECMICGVHFDTDMLNHIRLFHPDVLDQRTEQEVLSLKPVTQEMDDADHVCEQCDRQFEVGMFFGESFEGMFHGHPIVSLVCGDCFIGAW